MTFYKNMILIIFSSLFFMRRENQVQYDYNCCSQVMAGGRTVDVMVFGLVGSAAVFGSEGRLLSMCLMIYRFFSNELALSKCIIWSLITRATVSLAARGARSQPATGSVAVLCKAKCQAGKGWVLLDVNHPQRWLIDGNKAVFVFSLKCRNPFDLYSECLAE